MTSTKTSASTDVTLGTISGTPVLFYPVPTPWASVTRCGDFVWRMMSEGSMFGWDPGYWNMVGTGAEGCFQPQMSSWWYQNDISVTPSTALGPTFVCPESFSAVHTTTMDGDGATRTEFTYCCPPEYTLNTLPPPTSRAAAQCASTIAPGRTLSHITATYPGVSKARWPDEPIAYLPTTTVVQGSAATVFAPPVNGFNLVKARGGGGSGSGSGGGGLSLGASVGIAAGASLAGVGVVYAGIWLVWRRRRQGRRLRRGQRRMELSAGGEGEEGVWSSAAELPEKREAVEMALGVGVVEMPQGREIYELPDHRAQAYEILEERGRREDGISEGDRRESRVSEVGRRVSRISKYDDSACCGTTTVTTPDTRDDTCRTPAPRIPDDTPLAGSHRFDHITTDDQRYPA
ncbi:hypothetical protein C8A05DRAFT_39292 [Staphylotrichum tortipilum]|uniref:Uncharacterized protein n=1 Tax=Staphylotrichum tortipilum TaxID=2831512 RepID=A0AAN6MB31_9PEZI|nr:hypothetical protein C8A05DRAFT_39292 [Staphylotrichum longicolle]